MNENSPSFLLALEFFSQDLEKAHNWYFAENPLLGGCTPKAYAKRRGEGALIHFIETQLSENLQ